MSIAQQAPQELDYNSSDVEKAQQIPYEIPVEAIERYLLRDCNKARQYRVLPLYLAFMFLIGAVLVLHRIDFVASDVHTLQARTQQMIDQENFAKVQDPGGFYEWVRNVTKAMFTMYRVNTTTCPSDINFTLPCNNNTNNTAPCVDYNPRTFETSLRNLPVVPVNLIILRQIRVKGQACDYQGYSSLDSTTADLLGITCYPSYDDNYVDWDSYGPNDSFISNAKRSFSVRTIYMQGENAYKQIDGSEYHEYIHYSAPFQPEKMYAIACNRLKFLEDNDWIDSATRFLALDLVMYSRPLDQFIARTQWIEIGLNGYFTPNTYVAVVNMFRLGTYENNAIFALDLLVTLFLAYFVFDALAMLRHNYVITDSVFNSFGMWEVYTITNIALFMYVQGMRFHVWRKGTGFSMPVAGRIASQEDQLRAMDQFLHYGDYLEQMYEQYAGSFIFSWMRVFYFLQYNERLNILTETVKYSVNSLVGMLLTIFVIVVSYASAATLLFGQYQFEFRSLVQSFTYMFKLLPAPDFGAYDPLSKIHPYFTAFFYVSFFIIAWLVVLNMVLGIVAASFQTVQENATKTSTWSPEGLWEDIRKFFAKNYGFGGETKSVGNMHVYESASVAAAKSALHMKSAVSMIARWFGNNKYVLSRVGALKAVRNFAETKNVQYIRHEDLEEVFPMYDIETREHLYLRARGNITSAHEARQLQERHQNHVLHSLVTLQRSIDKVTDLLPQIRSLDNIYECTQEIDGRTKAMNDVVKHVDIKVRVLDNVTQGLPTVVGNINEHVVRMGPVLDQQKEQVNFMMRLHEDSVLNGSGGKTVVPGSRRTTGSFARATTPTLRGRATSLAGRRPPTGTVFSRMSGPASLKPPVLPKTHNK
jgi:hypothetical protein